MTILLVLLRTLGFGATHEYLNVQNSVGIPLSIVIDANEAGVNVGGDVFTGTYLGSGVQFVVTDPDGAQLFVTLNETSARKCTGSGRGQNCHNVWTLVSGEIAE